MSTPVTLLVEAIARLFWYLVMVGVLTPLELILPEGRRTLLVGRLQGVTILVVYVSTMTMTYWGVGHLRAIVHLDPIASIDLSRITGWAGPLSGFVSAGIAFALSDFGFYWFHRAQHAVPWLWRFHSVHHSIRDMNAVNSYHHITEPMLQAALITLPLSLFPLRADHLAVVGMIGAIQAIAIHSPTRLHAGPLRVVLADNRFHRIHHSLEPKHFDKNFGSVVSIWDTLFGTAYWPRREEWPDTGLEDVPEPTSIQEWLFAPFRFRPGRLGAPVT